ncbi:MAG: FAD-binding protein [bacterium]|nr:FAD-binding protein [bacterium]
MIEMNCDVLVVGSGGSGAAAAAHAAESGARVLLISKDPIACSDSKIAHGIVTVRGVADSSDTVAALQSNMRLSGDDINDPTLTRVFAEETPEAYDWLRREGLRPDFSSGRPATLGTPMGGHSHDRSVRHRNRGIDYAHSLTNAIGHAPQLETLEDAWLLDLAVTESDGRRQICGALVYHASEGRFIGVRAPAIVLACGGASTLYFPNTDTMRGNTGDGYAAALRAGAELVDMEQVQFLPFAAPQPRSHQGLLMGEPVMAGPLGVVRDATGKIILNEVMLRTRADAAAAIAVAVAEGRGTEHGGAWWDLTPNMQGRSGALFKAIMERGMGEILDTVRASSGHAAANLEAPWEVRPTAHYFMGGISVGADCRAIGDAPVGLYAAGQVMGGLHGSNRLGSTSLAECLVFGRIAGRSAAAHAARTSINAAEAGLALGRLQKEHEALLGRIGERHPIEAVRTLQRAAWEGLGPARTEESICRARDTIAELEVAQHVLAIEGDMLWNQSFIDAIELRNMLITASAVAESAANREDTVGAHVRIDHRNPPATPYSIAVRLRAQGFTLERVAREPTPLRERLRIKLGFLVRFAFFKLLQRLPIRVRDELLFRILRKAAPADVVAKVEA